MQKFLQDPGSLTKKLKAAAKSSFSVQRIFEGFILASPLKYPLLSMKKKQFVWCRRVRLLVDGAVWIEAESVTPFINLKGKMHRLFYLKDRALGEFLFSYPNLKRSSFQIKGSTRASVFNLDGQRLLLTESFTECALAYFNYLLSDQS